MAASTTASRGDARTLANVSVALGILAILAFFVLGFAVGDWWFVVAFVIGVAAVVTGWTARNRPGNDHRRTATIGIVLGAVPAVWFIVYIVVDSIA